jgi:hypothetical protein
MSLDVLTIIVGAVISFIVTGALKSIYDYMHKNQQLVSKIWGWIKIFFRSAAHYSREAGSWIHEKVTNR